MTVVLDGNGRPVAYGSDRLNGQDIPNPPEPAREYRWDGTQWVHDPTVPTTDVSTMTDADIASALRSGDLSARETIAQFVEDGRI